MSLLTEPFETHGAVIDTTGSLYEQKLSEKPVVTARHLDFTSDQSQEDDSDFSSSLSEQSFESGRCDFPVSMTEVSSSATLSSFRTLLLDHQLILGVCKARGYTITSVMKAGWSLLLHAYTGAESVGFRYICSGEGLSALRHEIFSIETPAELIEKCQNVQGKGYSLRTPRLSEKSLFNTVLVVKQGDEPLNTDETFETLSEVVIYAKVISQTSETILDFSYQPDLVSVELAQSVSRTFQTIIRSMLTALDQPISTIHGLDEHDKSQILRWNDNVPPILRQKLHDAFTEKALDNPEALAISTLEQTWTYSEIDNASTQLCEYLESLRAGPDASQMVLSCFEPSPSGIITVLAILKAGLICVPVSPRSHDELLLDKIIEDVKPQILCVSGGQAHQFASSTRFHGTVVVVDTALLNSLEASEHKARPAQRPVSDIAFIQYTSGVTGPPKGVIQGHAGLYTGILAQGQAIGYDIDSRVLHSADYSMSAGIAEVFGAFFYGGCVVIIPREYSPEIVAGMISEQEVTHACLKPTEARNLDPADLWNLGTIALGGERLSEEDVERWGLEMSLVKTYGTAETSVYISASKAPSPYVFDPSNIGSPFVASMWVVQQENFQRLAPIGAVGELVVGGPTLALGYINDPQQTAANFIVNPDWAPLSSDGGEQRFFLTGDLVRHLGNGELVLCGRKDDVGHRQTDSAGPVETNKVEIPPFSLIDHILPLQEALATSLATCNLNSDMIEDIYPSTAIQESLFALSNKQAGAFLKQHIFHIPSSLDLDQLRNAWALTIQQTPILRTRLIMSNSSRLLQVVVKEEPICQCVSDLEAYVKQDQETPMSLGAPLFRHAIVNASGQDAHLIVTMHHALYDGWTLDLIFERVKKNFEGGTVSNGIQFNSFVKYVQDLDRDQVDQFWVKQLDNGGATPFPALPYPTYLPNPNETYMQNLSFQRAIGSTITASTFVRAAWALTIARYADLDDITFGSTVSGRAAAIPGIADMLGPTIATIPVRLSVPKDMKLVDFLRNVQEQSTMSIPFEQAGMYHIKQLTESTQTVCSFQTALVVQPLAAASALEDLGCRLVNEMYDSYQPYALTVEVGLQENGGIARALFDNKVVDRPQVRRIMAMFNNTLRKISRESSNVILDELATITAEDIAELKQWNKTPPGPVIECVHRAFEKHVRLNPSAPAIASWDGDFTYGELDALSSRLASKLLDLGVTLEMVVPLCFDKSKWVIVSMLAVLKSGGACLTLDTSHPPDRLQTMVEAVNGRIMLVEERHQSKFINTAEKIIVVDECLFKELNSEASKSCEVVKPNNRAFVVFTSGSTGNPKGIELEHQSVCTSSRGHAAVFNIQPGSRCLQFSAFAFDVHISDIFTPLMYGACCCIPSEQDRLGNLPRAINSLRADSVYITPTVATLFTPSDVPGLKKVALGGEPLTTENARLWGGQVFLINVFGPSETSNWVTYKHVLPDTQQPSNIGPGVDVCTWLVDRHNDSRLAPIGCVGEVFVEGPILARGYLNDQAKTDAAFVIDPSWLPASEQTSRRMYRTGDLVRYNSDGTYVYVGRQDTQVKIRGQRLELAEVNHRLMEIPEVKTCLAVLPKTGLCQGRCVAVLSLRDFWKDRQGSIQMIDPSLRAEVSTQIANIRDRLTETLAVWMIPTSWIVVEDLPTNAAGKLDRNKIRTFADNLDDESFQRASDLLADSHFQEPQTELEFLLQRIWSSVLKLPIDQISATASFLRLGGDSITAMQVMSKCRVEGVVLSVHDILISRTITDLASLASSASEAGEAASAVDHQVVSHNSLGAKTVPDEVETRALYKTIFSQASLSPMNVERATLASDYQISALEQMLLSFRGDLTYHTFDIQKPVDFNRLALSCVELVNRHPLLRSVFVCHERKTYQVTMKSSFVDLTDRHDHPEPSVLIEEDINSKFRLGQPMVWFKLARRASSYDYDTLVLRLPHCLYDASTRASLVADLQQAYLNTEPFAQPLDIQPYFDFRDYIRPTALKYWEKYLEGSTSTQIVAKPLPRFRHGRQHTLFSKLQLESLESLKVYGITSATLVKAAWGFTLAELCGEEDVVFGEIVAGRGLSVAGIDSLDIVCASTIPLRIQLHPSWNVLDLLKDVQERHLASMPFESVGEASIVRECTSWPQWARFGSVLNYSPLPTTESIESKALRPSGIHGNLNPASDLNIQCHPIPSHQGSDSSFEIKITFDIDYIATSFATDTMNRLTDIIESFARDTTASLGDFRKGPIGGRPLPFPFNNGPIDDRKMVPLDAAEYEQVLSKVQSAWKTVIGEIDEMDTPFFSYWGTLIAAAHFVAAYRELGVDISMEEVIEAPTMRAQVIMCADR